MSEVALALKNGRPVILLDWTLDLLFEGERSAGLLCKAKTPEECVAEIEIQLMRRG